MNGSQYKNELFRLKELASGFAEAFPALAPMLGGPADDPDVERLLEGAAYNTALLRRKLTKAFPGMVNDLTQLYFPHYLRPFPAASIVAFSVPESLNRSFTVPAGTRIASVPVDNTSCMFSTAWDVEVHPLQLNEVAICRPPLRGPTIVLSLELKGLPLREWRPGNLCLFMNGDYVTATELFMLLCRHLKRIMVEPDKGGTAVELSADCLKPMGFDAEEPLAPYPPNAFPGFRLLQEYFDFPERYLFFELTGWEKWENRGDGKSFTVSFELESQVIVPAQIRRESITLFAVPAANVFAHEADPVLLDHRKNSYLLRPSGQCPGHFQIYTVNSVSGFMRDTGRKRSYEPFDMLRTDNRDKPVYHTGSRKSLVHDGYDVYLSLAYPPDCSLADEEVLSVKLTCSNGSLSGSLRAGDISFPVDPLPGGVSVRNIAPVTTGIFPPLEPDLQRRCSAHLSLNCLSLATAESLRSLLELYLFTCYRRLIPVVADRKRISGIESVAGIPCERWVSGVLMRGREIRIKARGDHFSGPGDMYFFGCLLGRFLGQCAAPNVFTVLSIEDSLKGDCYQWPPRLGRQPLG